MILSKLIKTSLDRFCLKLSVLVIFIAVNKCFRKSNVILFIGGLPSHPTRVLDTPTSKPIRSNKG